MRRKAYCEPEPIWRDAPRLCPQRTLPAHRYVPGLSPRPALPLFRAESTPPGTLPIGDAALLDDALPLGIDLYHHGYFWEAHEVWEGLWRRFGRNTTNGMLVQALIYLAAAQIKANAGIMRGAIRHGSRASETLCRLRDSRCCDHDGRLLGVNLVDLAQEAHNYFVSLWKTSHSRSSSKVVQAPRIDWSAESEREECAQPRVSNWSE